MFFRLRPGWQRFRFSMDAWTVASSCIVVVICLPVLTLLFTLLLGESQFWGEIAERLPDYLKNTSILLIGTAVLSLLMGVPTAWLVTFHDFPGRRYYEWALILPLAIPTYIAATTYKGILDFTGPVQTLLRNSFGAETARMFAIDIMTMWGAVLVMSAVLYPYIYVTTRVSFLRQSASVLEVSRSLGRSAWQTFTSVGLPLARPAIIGGLILVLMEALNDYGAVKYYEVHTLTVGIFHAWSDYFDEISAVRLSGCLLLFVFALMSLERWQRGRKKFNSSTSNHRSVVRYPLKGMKALLASVACFIPLALGFLIPAAQLTAWSLRTAGKVVNQKFIILAMHSFLLALAATAFVIVIGILILYTGRLHQTRHTRVLSKISLMGYMIPGAVLAIGVMILFKRMDNGLSSFWQSAAGGLVLSGTVFAMTYAYVVRFLAVGHSPLEAGFKRLSPKLDEASRSLGLSKGKTLFKINLPLMKGAILGAAILVFIDVLKELPLTLILQPFNFETLATRTFQLAGEEMLAESANSALVILVVGTIPIMFLNKIITRDVQ
jgi:iron(III) transport system permease protein